MAGKGLTEAWRNAHAAKPAEWQLMGVACGPREVDPAVRSPDEWCAWARGPNNERIEGRDGLPEDALLQLTVHLKAGFFNPGGIEFPLSLLGTAITLAITGAGAFSLDALLAKRFAGSRSAEQAAPVAAPERARRMA